jgi:hypothetical protein
VRSYPGSHVPHPAGLAPARGDRRRGGYARRCAGRAGRCRRSGRGRPARGAARRRRAALRRARGPGFLLRVRRAHHRPGGALPAVSPGSDPFSRVRLGLLRAPALRTGAAGGGQPGRGPAQGAGRRAPGPLLEGPVPAELRPGRAQPAGAVRGAGPQARGGRRGGKLVRRAVLREPDRPGQPGRDLRPARPGAVLPGQGLPDPVRGGSVGPGPRPAGSGPAVPGGRPAGGAHPLPGHLLRGLGAGVGSRSPPGSGRLSSGPFPPGFPAGRCRTA